MPGAEKDDIADGLERSPNGLMAFWARIDDDYVLQYQQWHNCEHIPERVSIAGFLRGRRYRIMDNSPHFLMIYETQNVSVLGSDAYKAALDQPTSWTKEALQRFREPIRNAYNLVASHGVSPAMAAPYVISLRFNLDDGEGLTGFRDRLAQLVSLLGGIAAHLYRLKLEVTSMMTQERRIYGGNPGAQEYLVLLESSLAPDLAGSAFPMLQGLQDLDANAYWLEFEYDKEWRQKRGTVCG